MRLYPTVPSDLAGSFDKLEAKHLALHDSSSLSEESEISRPSLERTNSEVSLLSSSALVSLQPPPKVASSAVIRSRFLNRLGFSKECMLIHEEKLRKAALEEASRKTQRLRSDSFQEVLKGDYGKPCAEETDCRSAASSACSLLSQRRSRGVSFDSKVTVHPIPPRTSYSDRIRCHIWMSPEEMQENAARNCVEFAAENWDWRQAADDHDMVIYEGERIHPVHFVREYSLRDHMMAVMYAQQQQQQSN